MPERRTRPQEQHSQFTPAQNKKLNKHKRNGQEECTELNQISVIFRPKGKPTLQSVLVMSAGRTVAE